MPPRDARDHLYIAAVLIAVAGQPASVFGQDAQPQPQPQPTAQPQPASPAGVAPGQDAGEARIRFTFSEAPFGEVLDYFSRAFGLPVIRETGVPGSAMSFISAERYRLADALEILNLNLAPHGVRLVREANFLYLRSLNDAARKATDVVGLDGLEGIDPTAYVTVTIPLNNASAKIVADQIKTLVKEPGAVQAVPVQNLIVLVETAAQARRIRAIIQRIDAVRPVDSEYRIFRLQHAKPADAVKALRGLVGQRIEKQIIEKDGSIRKVEEVDLSGLSIEADERTNSIIAVGSSSRLQTVDELIRLLDQPEGGADGGGVELTTFTLESVTPAEVAGQIESLFRGVAEGRRPTVLPIDSASKVVVVGEPGLLMRAAALVGEIDPGAAGGDGADRSTTTRAIPLRHITPEQAVQVASRMISPRQSRLLRFTEGPSGGLLVSGPTRDVATFGSLIESIDAPSIGRRDTRRVRIQSGDAASVLSLARELDALTGDAARDPVEVIESDDGKTLTLVGSPAGIERFERRLRAAQGDALSSDTRTVRPRSMTPAALAAATRDAAERLTQSDTISGPLSIVSMDDLGYVSIRGSADVVAAVEALAIEIDAANASPSLRVLDVPGGDPAALVSRAVAAYEDRAAASSGPGYAGVRVENDAATGRYIARGDEASLRLFESILAELSSLAAPERVERIYDITNADAGGVMPGLQAMLEQSGPVDRVRRLEPPVIDVAAGRVNALRVVAAESQHGRIASFIGLLDRVDVESRTYGIERTRPSELAGRLARLAPTMLAPTDGSPYRPPTFDAIDDLSTLVVRATADQFAAIDGLVAQLDAERPGDRQLRIVPLRGPDPESLVRRAERLYAEQSNEGPAEAVDSEYDAASGTLLLRGRAEAVERFASTLAQAERLVPPLRETRLVDIRNVEADKVVGPLRELLEQADSIDAARAVPDPEIRVIERTNSLMVTAEAAQHRMIEDFVRRLDTADQTEPPPLRLLQLRTADVNAIAQMLTQQYENRPLTDRAARPVQVRADATTGTLIVSAHPDLFDDIRAFVEQLNAEGNDGPARETFIFPLKIARATDVASAMDRLYPEPPTPVDRRGNPMPWLRERKEVTVSADASSNALIIDAPAERRESLVKLAETLDNVQAPAAATLRTYRIVNADLDAVANMLRGLARRGTLSGPAQPGRQPVEAVIEIEPRSQTLIVAGDARTFEQVESILADLTAVPIERGLRIVPIANAAAGAVRDRAMAIYAAQIAQIEGAGGVDITVDETTNALEIVADDEAMGRFMGIIEELQRQIGPAREVRLIELRLAKVGDVIATLRDLVRASESLRASGGPEPVFEPIESTNALMVAAQPDQFRILEALVRSLDSTQNTERPPLRILRLRSTDAASIAQVLSRSYSRRPPEERALKPVEVEADGATNTLIVSAHPDVLPEIESIIAELNDAQALDRDGREIRIFPLKVARAEDLARTIDQMYPEPPMPRDRRGSPMPWLQEAKEVVVRADVATNALIVDAPAQRLAGFEQIVQSLDTLQASDDVELRSYMPRRADIDAIAGTLRELASGNALGAAGRTPVTVSVEPSTRTLIVSGPSSIFGRVEQIIGDVDAADDRPATTLRMYRLRHARAERLADLLRGLLAGRVREAIGRDGEVADREADRLLDVTADRASNTLLISAPEAIQAIAEQLLESLDSEAASVGRAVVRVVPLTFADAGDVARTLGQAIPTLELPAGGPVSVVPASGANALLLTGASVDLALVESLIDPLDRQPFDPEKPSIETFALEYASASEIARTVERLLIDQQQTDPRVLALRLRYNRNAALAETPRIRVEAEPRTNSLVVSGPAETVGLARAVIERLDQPPRANPREVTTFTPARGDPERLAVSARRVLEQTLEPQRDPLEIIAEASTRSLLIIGTPAQAAEAARVLGELDDRTPAMPLVEVRRFELVHAAAESVAGTLRSMLDDRTRWPEALRRAAESGVPLPGVTIDADAATNRILLSAPAALVPLAADLVATIDTPRRDGAIDVRVFSLSRGDAVSVARALTETMLAGMAPGERPATITAEPGSNTVIIAAPAARLEQAAGLIASMDAVATEPAQVGVRTIFLEYAKAQAIAPIIERVLVEDDGMDENTPWWIRQQMQYERIRQGEVGTPPTIRVEAEPRLNAIVVSAPIGVLELAEEVARGLDVDPSASDRAGARTVRVISLVNADAGELAENIAAVFAADPAVTTPPTIRVDRGSNAMIVSATTPQMAEIDRLASTLDNATLSTRRELRTIPIDPGRANAADVARTLERLLRQRGGVRVEVLSIDELIEREAVPSPGASSGPSSALPTGDWRSTVFATVASAAIGQVAAVEDEPNVTIAVDSRTNALVIIGSPRIADQLALLAAEIERELPAEPSAVRIIELPASADARAIAGVVSQTVREVGRSTRDNPGGFSGRVAVTADPAGGSLIVWANDTDFAVVSRVIAGVASPQAAVATTVKVYPLVNADANSIGRAVQDLFQTNPRGRQAQRLRRLDLRIDADNNGNTIAATIDPSQVSIAVDPSGRSLIVAAPQAAFGLIDRFIGLLDQSPVTDRMGIRRYALQNADAEALAGTIQSLLDAQRSAAGGRGTPRARVVADERTNALLVTASGDQHDQIAELVQSSDVSLETDAGAISVITLSHARPSEVQRVLEQVLIGRDPARAERIRITAQDDTGKLVVRASDEDRIEIERLVAEVDVAGAGTYPVRSITLERADAAAVAKELERFFQQRARVSGRRGNSRGGDAAIIGERRSGTLVIAASDDDYEQIAALAAQFDAPAAELQSGFRVIQLENARATDVAQTLNSIAYELQYERLWSGAAEGDRLNGKVLISTNERANALIIFGEGTIVDTMETIIAELDREGDGATDNAVRAIRVENADLNALERLIENVTTDPTRQWWQSGRDRQQVLVEVDQTRRLLILVGQKNRVDEAAGYIEQLAAAATGEAQEIETITLRHARADRASRSIRDFFTARARSEQRRADAVAIIGSTEGNLLIVSGPPEDLAIVRDLVGQIDRPEMGNDRRIEVYRLGNVDPAEAAGTLRSMFPASGPIEDRIIVTPQPSINALIVSAPDAKHERLASLLGELDRVRIEDAAGLMRITLESARAVDIAALLTAALPDTLRVRITPEPRTNTLLVTGSEEALELVRRQVGELDQDIDRQPVVFRRFELRYADDSDLSFTLRTLLRSRPRQPSDATPNVDYSTTSNAISVTAGPDEMAFIERMVAELDVPEQTSRRTEFVRLEFADAKATSEALGIFFGRRAPEARAADEREVSIYADAASNSLVISGPDTVFDKIRGLLTTLDTAEYDTSRQLVVIPLKHADATSVARALAEGFRAPLEQQIARDQAEGDQRRRGGNGRGDDNPQPQRTVLVSVDDTPSVSAEVQTNALVVFASREDIARIRGVVESLDVPETQRLPEARLIAVDASIRPSVLAESLRRVFPARDGARGPERTVIVGDDNAGVLIVRAPVEAFGQIATLAASLQTSGVSGSITPRLYTLNHASAARMRETLLSAFRPIADRRGEDLVIEIDRPTNALVISASSAVFDQVTALAALLDDAMRDAAPADERAADSGDDAVDDLPPGDPLIVDLQSVSPQDMIRMLGGLGITEAPTNDRPSLVAEPVRLVAMRSRRALAVLAGPADQAKVASIIRRLDAAPPEPGQRLAVIPLRRADASRAVSTLEAMLRPATGDGKTDPAAAAAEQVRRLALTTAEGESVTLDLTYPIKLTPDPQTNAIIVASTDANVQAVAALVPLLDALPMGDAIVVRIFPLQHALALRVRSMLLELFESDAIARSPGSNRETEPSTMTGRALSRAITVTVDERTNAVIVAGEEEAVGLAEVLVADIDADNADRGRVELSLIPLEFADAVPLARKLREVLVEGISDTPEAAGLQRQFGRLRTALGGVNAGPSPVDADIFAPLSDLAFTPEENLNALIVLGTPANLAVVQELVDLLDIERAAAANTVRVIPLQHAEATRLASVIGQIFDGRAALEATRPEDRLIISVDARTNAIIVSTSPGSFTILESLLGTLDQPESRFAVGLHVLPVPGADAQDLAPKIQRLMQDRIEATRRRGGVDNPLDVFRIEPVPASDLLIVACSEENLGLVRELIAALTDEDEAVAGAERFELIPLISSGRAGEIADAIDELYVSRENVKRGQRSVSVVASERQNALLVSGTAVDIEAVRALAESLDVAAVETVQEVKRIPLRAANAFEIVRLLEELLAGRPIGGRGGAGARQATKLRFYRGKLIDLQPQGSTEATIDGALREQVRLTPDLRTNSVLVSAPPEIMTLIEEIVSDLDAETSGDRRVEQFRLENADAQQMALLLRDLFNLQQDGDRLVLVPRQRGGPDDEATPDGAAPASDEQFLTPVPDQRQALAITVDRRTNTLLVSATPDYLEEVRRVVLEIDRIEANERERIVYELNNAQAKEVEETLRTYFSGEAELRRSTLGPQLSGSLARQLEQEVTVVGDEKSNKLLISASPRYIQAVAQLVQEIDAPPPQVLIQVLLAEVTLDDDFTFGVDFNIGLDTATSRIGNRGYVFEELAAGAGVATALGVPNFSVLSQDFRLLVRALEVQGKLEVLSRPHVTVRNNEDARIQVGEDVGIPVGTDAVGERVSINVERRDVGIILNVRPSIAPDGTVRMNIRPEISSVSPNTTSLGNGLESPIITQRQVETTVTVGDGQTIVIGGLIQTTNSVQESKIPLLGDIPILGGIFRTTERNTQKTELLVILTPTVIPGDQGRAQPIQQAILGNRLGQLADPTPVKAALERDTIKPGDSAFADSSWWESDSPGVAGPDVDDTEPGRQSPGQAGDRP